MKFLLRFLFAGLLVSFVSSVALGQSQAVLTVDIKKVAVSGGGSFGTGGTISASPNESYGPALSQVTLTAQGVGTNPSAGYTYTFFVNGISIGGPLLNPLPAATSPGIVSWTPPQPGSYFITVKIVDDLGNAAVSLPIRYFATGTQLISPLSSTLVPIGSSLVIKGDATPSGGFIKQIDFYADGALIGSDVTAPYSIIYTPSASPSVHTIEVRAIDNTNTQVSPNGTALRTITMVAPVGTSPTVAIASPIDGSAVAIPNYATLPSSSIPVSVSANDADGILSKVELYIDGVLFATGTSFPYTFNWQPPVIGSFRLVALAYDDKNNVTASAPSVVSISAPPIVSIISPAAGATVSAGSPTQISANATDSDGSVVRVQFFADGTLIGEKTSAPYTQSWTPTQPTGAVVLLTALATDNLGLTTVSSSVSVTVTGSGGGGGGVNIGQPPVVSVTSPVASTQLLVGAPTTISASATDPDGNIFSVQFFVNNVNVGTDTTYPYSTTWTPTSLGIFAITAKAIDNDGNAVTSAVVSVTAIDPTPSAPTVAITAPSAGAALMVGAVQTITATASDDGAITGVQFYINGQPFGSLITTFPYKINWTPGSPGAYNITARATDNSGLQTTATPVAVTVSGGTAPTIALTNPAAGSIVALGSGVQIIANASDSDGRVTQVQFYANGTLINTVGASPFIANWIPTAAGTYSLTGIATDNTGNTTTSAPISVTVLAASAPVIVISNPTANSTFNVGTSIPINALVTGGNGAIAQVQFFVNGINVGIDASAPYTATWTPASAGAYAVFAVVTDSAGVTGTSAVTTVTIKANSPPSVAFISPGTNLTVALGTSVNLSASASDSDGTITSVRFFANGTVLDTVSSPPYSTTFTPTAGGVYSVVAQAADNAGNITDSTPLTITVLGGSVPIVFLDNPGSDTTISADSNLLLSAAADVSNGTISRVEFYAGPSLITTLTAAPYTYVWRPPAIGSYPIRAVAYSGNGPGISSSVSTVTVTPAAGAPGARYVNLINPSNGLTIVAFRNITFTAVTNIPSSNPSIDFYSNGRLFQTVSTSPYQTTRNPSVPGRYEFYAVMRTSTGTYTSSPAYVTVLPNQPPTVSISAPSSGSSIVLGSSVTIRANASDPDDAIDNVQFLINGQPLTTANSFPYTATWQPVAEGVYTLSAIVKDSLGSVAGNQVTAAPIYVRVVAPASSGGVAPDTTYAGTYISTSESGKFAVINIAGKNAVFIGYSTSGASKNYFYSGLPVDAGGGFAKTDSSGRTMVNGVTSDTGVSGNLDGTRLTFIGPVTFAASSTTPPSGYYTGNLAGKLDSTVAAIVGLDSSITAYVASGSSTDAGSGRLNANGTFSFVTAGGNTFSGKIEAATGLFTGTLSGANGGSVIAALATGGSFSDGSLRNLSTRGQVGTGANILIAGFVVGGTAPKQVLIRAIGPSLTQFGVTGALADPQLSVFQGNTAVAANDNWGGSSPLVAASAQVGGFALPAASKDAVVLTTLNPGAYTAQVSGVGGTTGVALVELYDVDAATPFSPQKVMNVATRGVVSSGQGALIAGFVVSGTVPKKLLIRAVGPTLTSLSVAGALADPILRVIRNDNVVIRENDNWEVGNEPSLITDATTRSGAFALTAGSKDAAIVISLPAGTYTAQVSGANGTGGVALVEVYEVP